MNHGVADQSQKPEFPTLYSPHPRANIAREWGTHSLKVRDKIHNGKEDGPPSLDAKQLLSDLFGRCVCSGQRLI